MVYIATHGQDVQSEIDLIRRVACGDHCAFEQLYRAYAPRLRTFLYRMLRRRGMTEEVVDDTLLVVWHKARFFVPNARPSSWIYAIAQRKALKALARSDRMTRTFAAANEDSFNVGPEGELDKSELREHVAQALTKLPIDQSTVVRLAYFEGYGCREIAGIVDCPVDTVKTRAFHARRKLRLLLNETSAERCASPAL